jgi:hypothetical protein
MSCTHTVHVTIPLIMGLASRSHSFRRRGPPCRRRPALVVEQQWNRSVESALDLDPT